MENLSSPQTKYSKTESKSPKVQNMRIPEYQADSESNCTSDFQNVNDLIK